MMYHKALLFNDTVIAAEILESAEDPKKVKALGRKVKGFKQETWDAEKFGIVVQANREKFGQDKTLGAMLIGTKGRDLIEASPLDKIWGIGFTKDNATKNQARWGQNLLGNALMQVRDELLAQNTSTLIDA
jgi:ribA/ribD-fused uncharacterized protein